MDGEFKLTVQIMHIIVGRRTEKNSKHTSLKIQINHLLRGLLRGRLVEFALTRHCQRQGFLLPAEVSLTK